MITIRFAYFFYSLTLPAEIGRNDEAANTFLRVIAWAIAMIVFYGWLGWYLINDGRFLFEILNREEPPDSLKDLKKDMSNSPDKQNL